MLDVISINHKKEETKLDVYIYPDDTVSFVLKKIAHVLHIDMNDIYIWTKIQITKDDVGILYNFLDNVFQGEKVIHINTFIDSANNYFDINIEKQSIYNMITYDDAYSILQSNELKHIIIPLNHYYLYGSYFAYIPYNPLQRHNESRVRADALYKYSLADYTIHTAIGNEDCKKLFVMTRSEYQKMNVMNIDIDVYYPSGYRIENKASVTKLISYLNKIEEEIISSKTDIETNKFLHLLYLSSKSIYNAKFPVDLSILFNAFETNEDIPFLKFKTYTNIYHKVYKPFVVTSSLTRDFDKWYNTRMFKMNDIRYISFKIRFDNNVYFACIIKDNLSIDIRFSFHLKDEKTITDIEKCIPKINVLLQFIQNLYKVPIIALLPTKLMKVIDSYNIDRISTYNISTVEKKTSKLNAESFILSKLFA